MADQSNPAAPSQTQQAKGKRETNRPMLYLAPAVEKDALGRVVQCVTTTEIPVMIAVRNLHMSTQSPETNGPVQPHPPASAPAPAHTGSNMPAATGSEGKAAIPVYSWTPLQLERSQCSSPHPPEDDVLGKFVDISSLARDNLSVTRAETFLDVLAVLFRRRQPKDLIVTGDKAAWSACKRPAAGNGHHANRAKTDWVSVPDACPLTLIRATFACMKAAFDVAALCLGDDLSAGEEAFLEGLAAAGVDRANPPLAPSPAVANLSTAAPPSASTMRDDASQTEDEACEMVELLELQRLAGEAVFKQAKKRDQLDAPSNAEVFKLLEATSPSTGGDVFFEGTPVATPKGAGRYCQLWFRRYVKSTPTTILELNRCFVRFRFELDIFVRNSLHETHRGALLMLAFYKRWSGVSRRCMSLDVISGLGGISDSEMDSFRARLRAKFAWDQKEALLRAVCYIFGCDNLYTKGNRKIIDGDDGGYWDNNNGTVIARLADDSSCISDFWMQATLTTDTATGKTLVKTPGVDLKGFQDKHVDAVMKRIEEEDAKLTESYLDRDDFREALKLFEYPVITTKVPKREGDLVPTEANERDKLEANSAVVGNKSRHSRLGVRVNMVLCALMAPPTGDFGGLVAYMKNLALHIVPEEHRHRLVVAAVDVGLEELLLQLMLTTTQWGTEATGPLESNTATNTRREKKRELVRLLERLQEKRPELRSQQAIADAVEPGFDRTFISEVMSEKLDIVAEGQRLSKLEKFLSEQELVGDFDFDLAGNSAGGTGGELTRPQKRQRGRGHPNATQQKIHEHWDSLLGGEQPDLQQWMRQFFVVQIEDFHVLALKMFVYLWADYKDMFVAPVWRFLSARGMVPNAPHGATIRWYCSTVACAYQDCEVRSVLHEYMKLFAAEGAGITTRLDGEVDWESGDEMHPRLLAMWMFFEKWLPLTRQAEHVAKNGSFEEKRAILPLLYRYFAQHQHHDYAKATLRRMLNFEYLIDEGSDLIKVFKAEPQSSYSEAIETLNSKLNEVQLAANSADTFSAIEHRAEEFPAACIAEEFVFDNLESPELVPSLTLISEAGLSIDPSWRAVLETKDTGATQQPDVDKNETLARAQLEDTPPNRQTVTGKTAMKEAIGSDANHGHGVVSATKGRSQYTVRAVGHFLAKVLIPGLAVRRGLTHKLVNKPAAASGFKRGKKGVDATNMTAYKFVDEVMMDAQDSPLCWGETLLFDCNLEPGARAYVKKMQAKYTAPLKRGAMAKIVAQLNAKEDLDTRALAMVARSNAVSAGGEVGNGVDDDDNVDDDDEDVEDPEIDFVAAGPAP